MHYLEEKCVAWLLKFDAIEQDDAELYGYAIQVLLITISPFTIVIFIGAVTGMLKNGLILIIPFMTMRKFSGGFHTRHPWTCMCLSTITLVLCMYLSEHIHLGIWLDLFTLLAILSIILFSPVDSDNRRLDRRENERYKKFAIVLVIVFGSLFVFLSAIHYDIIAICIAIGIILTAMLQIPCIVIKLMGFMDN